MYYGQWLDEMTRLLLEDEHDPKSLQSVGLYLDFHTNPQATAYIVNEIFTKLAERNACTLAVLTDPEPESNAYGLYVNVSGNMVALLRYMSMAEVACNAYLTWLQQQQASEEAKAQAEIETSSNTKVENDRKSIWGPRHVRRRANASD